MVNLNYKHKAGFSTIETVVGFFLFSSMMLLYLPAYYNELRRIDDASQTSQAWRLFSELVDVELDEQIEDEAKALVSEQLILNWEALNEDNVSEFACDLNYCYISLEGGSELYVEIQDLNF